MKNLLKYEGENVRIITPDNKIFKGHVTDYVYPEDNEPEGIESIIIKTNDNRYVEFPEHDIKSIEIIK